MQFGSLNQAGLIFETGYRTMFELKKKKLNSNEWAAREGLLGRPSVTPQRGAQLTGRYTGQWLIKREAVRGDVVRWIRMKIDGCGSSSMMNRSLASSNPRGSVGVHRGHTGAPVTTARRANDEVDDGEL